MPTLFFYLLFGFRRSIYWAPNGRKPRKGSNFLKYLRGIGKKTI
jgi:hypothetical protein